MFRLRAAPPIAQECRSKCGLALEMLHATSTPCSCTGVAADCQDDVSRLLLRFQYLAASTTSSNG